MPQRGEIDRQIPPAVGAFVIGPLGLDGRGNAAGRDEVRRVIAIIDGHVRHEFPLLEQVAAARHVREHGPGLVPPCRVHVEMLARVVSEARKPGGGRVVGEGMEGHLVQPGAKGDVGQLLVDGRAVLPVLPAGEALGIHQGLAIDVRCAGGLLRHPVLAVVPKLSHGNIGGSERFQWIDTGVAAMPAFREQFQAALVEDFPREGVVVLHHQVADKLGVVMPEALALLCAADRHSRQDRQPWPRIVSVRLGETFQEIRRPVGGRPDLVAIVHQMRQGTEAIPPFRERIEDVIEVNRRGFAAEVVDNRALGIRAWAIETLVGVATNKAQDFPRSSRHRPCQPAFRIGFCIDHKWLSGTGHRHGNHRRFLKHRTHLCRQRQHPGKLARTLHSNLAPEKLLARIVRSDPRPAGVPAARSDHTEFQPEALRLVHRVVDGFQGLRPEESGAGGDDFLRIGDAAEIPDDGAAQALGLHFLQLAGDLLFIHITVQPCPQDGGTRSEGRVAEILLGERGGGK